MFKPRAGSRGHGIALEGSRGASLLENGNVPRCSLALSDVMLHECLFEQCCLRLRPNKFLTYLLTYSLLPTTRHRCDISWKGAVLPGRSDAEMGPANSFHASAEYSEIMKEFI